MIEPELQNYLSGINQHLVAIKAKKTPGIWRAFFNGMFGAFGYLVGVILIVILLAFILNKTGYLAQYQQQWQKFQDFMSQAENTMNTSQPQQGSGKPVGSIITLPDGTKVQVVK
jgi:hypothetical protein